MTLPVGFARITLNFTGVNLPTGGSVIYCIENPADDPASQLATEAITAWSGSTMPGHQSSDVSLTSVLCKKGPDETGASAVATASVPGAGGANSAPPGVCWLIHKHTPLGGRRGRGRMYVPGIPEGNVEDDGMILASEVTAINTDLVAWLAANVAAGTPTMLEHFPETEWVLVNGQPRRQPVGGAVPSPTVVSGMTCDPKSATQRRRLRR
jgi:hypothetical protein